jgi:hypothetical protein
VKPSAVVLILRKNHVFDTAGAIIRHNYDGFTGFPVSHVPAARRSDDPIDGYAVGMVLNPSPADYDFGKPIVFPTENDVCILLDAFVQSDKDTQKLLGRSWTRPRADTEELAMKAVLRLLEVSPDFGIRLARRVENSTKRMARLLQEHVGVNERRLLCICQS